MARLVGIKTKVAKALSHPAIGRLLSLIFQDRIPSRGCIVSTASPLITPEIKALLFWRLYESAEIRFVSRYLRRDLDVIELGSSLGVMACQLRKRISDSSKLVCVEAHPELASQISTNLDINGLNQKVSIVEKAIHYGSSKGDTVSFANGENNIAGRITSPLTGQGNLQVRTTTLSQVVKEHRINKYVLVSDIEGAEAGIIFQEKEALKNCQQIVIELHPTNFNDAAIDVEEMCNALISIHGFTLRDRYGPVCFFEK